MGGHSDAVNARSVRLSWGSRTREKDATALCEALGIALNATPNAFTRERVIPA